MSFQESTSFGEETYPGCRKIISESFLKRSVPESSIPIILASLSEGTLRQYEKPIRLWWENCKEKNIDLFEAAVPEILCFLTKLTEGVKTYGTLNSYRSAISLITNVDLGNNNVVKRFCKGVSVIKPQNSKYNDIWDPKLVLNYISQLGSNVDLNLEMLTKKLSILIALSTGQRLQTLSKIKIENIRIQKDYVKIIITDRIKTSGVGREQPILEFPFFKELPNLCVANTLKEYLKKTENIRAKDENSLFLTFKKPYHKATSQTISRWLKDILKKSGIDTNIYSGYSTRHASTSSAARKGVRIEKIRQAAGWTSSSNCFAKFYNRPLRDTSYAFASTVISS